MSDFVTVAKTSDIRQGRGKAFTVKGKRIAVSMPTMRISTP